MPPRRDTTEPGPPNGQPRLRVQQGEPVLPDPAEALRDRPDAGLSFEALLAQLLHLVRQGLARDCQLIGTKHLAELLGISQATLERLLSSGRIPRPTKLGSLNRWMLEEIREWVLAGMPARREWEARRKSR